MTMDIQSVLIPTIIIHPGMYVRDVFTECGKLNIHALPYYNEKGKLSGRLTLKNIMKFSCLPEHMIELAHLLGNQMSCIENAEAKAQEIICNPVEPYVRELSETISAKEPLIKALAMMEKNETSYIFVVDEEGEYKGLVTIQGIARVMSSLGKICPMNSSI
ncbi:CBS domain-containing protein [Candidatus Venteria ishoeyi]|uniref:CBS domain protein n=1 Tax=Candidatus Venteria ishoeyi TaxID=1899563 RepID=A0A1H6FE31_9GAMM|nr:CBS domain-containing protein [Candidatus Venteria ishoeyi]MDM8545866.1 CBS domain-containing protein [Candidatus Venteria ishoeyi]SEH08328.1 CBS domain protein [Candidatus Venteria ishoeyi]